jgi:putative endonuclease
MHERSDIHTTGKTGEALAAEYLQSKGHEILHRRFRYKNGELDIVARLANLLIFVEVKTINLRDSRSAPFGDPETWLSEKKKKTLYQCAEYYLWKQNIHDTDCRFDFITVRLLDGRNEINHIENAFWF